MEKHYIIYNDRNDLVALFKLKYHATSFINLNKSSKYSIVEQTVHITINESNEDKKCEYIFKRNSSNVKKGDRCNKINCKLHTKEALDRRTEYAKKLKEKREKFYYQKNYNSNSNSNNSKNTNSKSKDDYYKLLGIKQSEIKDIDKTKLKKIYYSLAMKWHPDRNHNNEDKKEAEEVFKIIKEAYENLLLLYN